MPPAIQGSFPIDGVRMPTWLLQFDKRGVCTSPRTRSELLAQLQAGRFTDIVVFSHGWNNDFDAAVSLYREFLKRFERALDSHPPATPFTPLFLGILWPSTWLVFGKEPRIAGAADPVSDPASAVVTNELADRVASQGGTDLERFYALMEQPAIAGAELQEFAHLVAPAFGTVQDDETFGGDRSTTAAELIQMLRDVERLMSSRATVAPDIDAWGAVGEGAPAGGNGADTPMPAGFLDKLDPRNALRLFSVYQMKDRAGTVGFTGVAAVLREVLAATAARVHAVGHSFGCKVMLSAICEPRPLPRPLASLLLLQPAISYLCFADSVPGHDVPGGYRPALDSARVRPPVFVTYSKLDFPLHETFHLALRRDTDRGELQIAADVATSAGDPPSRYAALGGYGPRRAGQKLIDPMPASGTPYTVPANVAIVAFDGSAGVINSHGDVRSDATAWALHQLIFRNS